MFYDYFLLVFDLPILFMVSFDGQKFQILMESTFFFMVAAFGVLLKKYLPIPRFWRDALLYFV